MNGSTFTDSSTPAVESHTLEIAMINGENITVKASIVEENKYRMQSSSESQNVFESNEHGMFKQVFTEFVEIIESL